MLTILIVDDEKIERNGVKFLLKREGEECRVLEASNGKDALGVLASNHVDIMFSDIKMPYMDGLELTSYTRENYPDIEIVIFSGYNDFSYAREALRYGVVDYVLKPVDPEEFHKTLERMKHHIAEMNEEKERLSRQEDDLKKYFLVDWLYTGNKKSEDNLRTLTEDPEDILNRCTRMILASASNEFFETEEEHFTKSLREQLGREMYYINLNSNEALFLFTEKYADYGKAAASLHQFLLRQYDAECYFAVSRPVSGWKELTSEFHELEALLGEQFYQPDQHILVSGQTAEEDDNDIPMDSELTERISKDIRYKDVAHIRQDFGKLEQKYRQNMDFSEMYVKFVFSGIVKELYEQIAGKDEKELARRVEKLYRCRKIGDILDLVSESITEYENCIMEQENGFREEVSQVKNYILHHYNEKNLSPENLAAMVYLSPGYLSTVFKEETGMTLNRYVRSVRMEKAKELLESTNMKIAQISREAGFSSSTYFCRSFREFYGVSPESCRKGQTADEKMDPQI